MSKMIYLFACWFHAYAKSCLRTKKDTFMNLLSRRNDSLSPYSSALFVFHSATLATNKFVWKNIKTKFDPFSGFWIIKKCFNDHWSGIHLKSDNFHLEILYAEMVQEKRIFYLIVFKLNRNRWLHTRIFSKYFIQNVNGKYSFSTNSRYRSFVCSTIFYNKTIFPQFYFSRWMNLCHIYTISFCIETRRDWIFFNHLRFNLNVLSRNHRF